MWSDMAILDTISKFLFTNELYLFMYLNNFFIVFPVRRPSGLRPFQLYSPPAWWLRCSRPIGSLIPRPGAVFSRTLRSSAICSRTPSQPWAILSRTISQPWAVCSRNRCFSRAICSRTRAISSTRTRTPALRQGTISLFWIWTWWPRT